MIDTEIAPRINTDAFYAVMLIKVSDSLTRKIARNMHFLRWRTAKR